MRKNKISILYVEDEEGIRDGLVPVLKYFSDELFVAVDGQDGLDQYIKYKPDIVVSDIKMPKMNGIEMVKSIKEINKKQHIIFTTAHSESGYFMDAIESHVDGYILKPIDLDILEEKILDLTEQITIKRRYKKQQLLMQEISALQDNLLVVLDEELQVIFLNKKSLQFFDVEDVEVFNQKYCCISSLFLEHEDFFSVKNKEDGTTWIDQLIALEDNERVVSLMDMGDSEYKSFVISLKKIEETSHIILNFSEVTNLTIEKKEFERKAFNDELTQIYNRAYFNEELMKQVEEYHKTHKPLSIIMFDIDKFKIFNDTYGHQIGDEVLKSLAQLIMHHTRDSDTFARWGGEEFVVVLPNTSLENAKKVAQMLRVLVEEHQFVDNLKVNCSFGVAEFDQNDNVESFVKKADDALYRAKENGRNRVEV